MSNYKPQRDPSVHIKKSDLIKLVKEQGITLGIQNMEIDNFVKECSRLSCRERLHIETTKPIKKKIEATAGLNDQLLDAFRRSLIFSRKKKGHKTFDDFKSGKKAQELREVAKIAWEYAKDFDLSIRHGFNRFCEFMTDKMGSKFWLNRMKQYVPDLYEATENELLEHHIGTEPVNAAIAKYCERYGLDEDKIPSREPFIKSVAACIEKSVEWEDYFEVMQSDFDRFDAVPAPKDFMNERMDERIFKALTKKNYKEKKVTKIPPLPDWYSRLKGGGK